MTPVDTLVIDLRFNGPSASANGGWAAGCLARRLGRGAVTVSLRAPPPLGVPLDVRRTDDGGLALYHGPTLLAEAVEAPLDLELPPAPDPDAAQAAGVVARMRSTALGGHWPYAHCYACGFARKDGLAIIPGPVGDDGMVATTWTPAEAVTQADGGVALEATWAALDCPAGIAWSHRLAGAPSIVTARMTAVVDRPLRAGERYTVAGWPIAQDGRKLHAGTAIFDASGAVRARSRQLWLMPKA